MVCLDTMMKAVNSTIKKRGDDVYFNRLLTYFQNQFKGKIKKFSPIRQYVFYVETTKSRLIIKGYPSFNRLRLQETFTSTLLSEGFHDTYSFIHPTGNEPLMLDNMYYGCIEYIEPHKKNFSFHSQRERREGLDLLREFHHVTEAFEKRYRTLLPKAQLLKKWQERAQFFEKNHTFLHYFLKNDVLEELRNWSNWSIDGMEKNSGYFVDEPYVILHGDVAHHNFLRDSSGGLKLIDFDLISIGPECVDIIQYVNRILPSLDWSLKDLQKYDQIKKRMKDRAFLFSLAYPADIFREWNRIIKDKMHTNTAHTQQVLDLTLKQFHLRQKFYTKLRKYLD